MATAKKAAKKAPAKKTAAKKSPAKKSPAKKTTGAKKTAAKAGTNLLHFARCAKLEKAGDSEAKIWFRTIGIAKQHLDETIGADKWKWCKVCEREITQKILNER